MGRPLPPSYWPTVGIPITMTDLRFMRFIAQEIFPGGRVPSEQDIVEFSRGAGFSLEETQLLSPDYVRTLDIWAANLRHTVMRPSRSRPKRSTSATADT